MTSNLGGRPPVHGFNWQEYVDSFKPGETELLWFDDEESTRYAQRSLLRAAQKLGFTLTAKYRRPKEGLKKWRMEVKMVARTPRRRNRSKAVASR